MFTKMFLVVLLVLAFVLPACVRFQKNPETAQPTTYQAVQQTAEPEMNTAEEQPTQKVALGREAKLSPKQIQTALKNAGFYKGTIDGKIGHKTKSAIKKFQTAKGLKADGVVGKKTAAILSTYLNQ